MVRAAREDAITMMTVKAMLLGFEALADTEGTEVALSVALAEAKAVTVEGP